MSFDWDGLKAAASSARANAYAPYSNFPVGAAALATDGRMVVGCNVENASYGLTLCAECGLISDLIVGGGGKLTHFVCLDANDNPLMPCGRCRQLLSEHGEAGLQVLGTRGVTTIEALLPEAFGPDSLA